MQAFEAEQVGQRQSLADIISNLQAETTPYTSMVPKGERPKSQPHQWQVENYPDVPFRGVVDGKDVDKYDSIGRDLLQCNSQKFWWNPAVSDFAEETQVAGVPSEMARQKSHALIMLKRQVEGMVLSGEDTKNDNGGNQGYETRGIFSWGANAAQTLYPVPAAYRVPAASRYTSTLALLTEAAFIGLCGSSYDQRKGPIMMDFFLGRSLKSAMTDWTVRDATGSATTFPVRTFNQDATARRLIRVIDRLILDTGECNLHLSSYLRKTQATGADSAGTPLSGVGVDLDKIKLSYSRLPRLVDQENKGGGPRAMCDAIALHQVLNPLGMVVLQIDS